jgi:hypothetical protein
MLPAIITIVGQHYHRRTSTQLHAAPFAWRREPVAARPPIDEAASAPSLIVHLRGSHV